MVFVPVSTYHSSKISTFNYHMCAYLVQITAMKCDAHPSNIVNYFKMFYAVVVILRGQLQALLIKYNQNNMVDIYQCIYRVLYWNILVNCQRLISIKLHHHVNVIQYFTLFNLKIANWMLLIILHTASVWFHCSSTKTIDSIIDYNIEKNDGCAEQYRFAYAL